MRRTSTFRTREYSFAVVALVLAVAAVAAACGDDDDDTPTATTTTGTATTADATTATSAATTTAATGTQSNGTATTPATGANDRLLVVAIPDEAKSNSATPSEEVGNVRFVYVTNGTVATLMVRSAQADVAGDLTEADITSSVEDELSVETCGDVIIARAENITGGCSDGGVDYQAMVIE